MKNKKVLTTFEHKTGSHFPNFIRITDQNRKWIEDLHGKFVEEKDGEASKFAFPSPSNKKFTCQAKYLKEIIKRFFAIDDRLYNPDNVRKAWDSYRNKTNFVDGTDAIRYQLNTGHSEVTRNKYFLKPATVEEITKFLDKKLNLIEDHESCYVADDDPPKPMPEVEDSQEEVEEQLDGREDENEERCDEDIHETLRPQMQLRRTEQRIRTKKIAHPTPYPSRRTTRFRMLTITSHRRKPRRRIHQKMNPLTHFPRKPKDGPRFVSNF